MDPNVLTEVIINKKVEIEFIDNTEVKEKKKKKHSKPYVSNHIIELYELRDMIDARIRQLTKCGDISIEK